MLIAASLFAAGCLVGVVLWAVDRRILARFRRPVRTAIWAAFAIATLLPLPAVVALQFSYFGGLTGNAVLIEHQEDLSAWAMVIILAAYAVLALPVLATSLVLTATSLIQKLTPAIGKPS